MGNLIADLKLFVSNGGNHLILKQDFHWNDDFLEGYMIVDREDIGAIIEFFASTEDGRMDSSVFEYNYDSVDIDRILGSLTIHSTEEKDARDMARIFGPRTRRAWAFARWPRPSKPRASRCWVSPAMAT